LAQFGNVVNERENLVSDIAVRRALYHVENVRTGWANENTKLLPASGFYFPPHPAKPKIK
jgi:hypothetical protein